MTATLTPTDITTAFRELQSSDPTAALRLVHSLIGGGWEDAPAMRADSRPDPDDERMAVGHLVCPHCEQRPSSITAVDYAIRETSAEVYDDTFETETIDFAYETAECHGMTYTADCCGGAVSLPQGWREAA